MQQAPTLREHRTAVRRGTLRAGDVFAAVRSSMGRRAALTIGLLLYAAAFTWAYASWVSVVWGYQGATYIAPTVSSLCFSFLLVPLPSFFLGITIERPSQIIFWIIYLTVFVPSLLVPSFVGLSSSWEIMLLSLTLTIGMTILALSYRLPLARMGVRKISPSFFWSGLAALWLVCNVILVAVYHGRMKIVGLAQVYDVRLEARHVAAASPIAGYASALAGDALNPLLMAFGIATGRKWILAVGVIGQVLIYSTAAMKSVLISPIVVVGVYFVVRKFASSAAVRVPFGMALACIVLAAGSAKVIGGIIFSFATMLLFRTLAIPGIEMAEYYDFFHRFPNTFYSQVTGVDWFVKYPYKLSLGREVSAQYLGNSVANANASFFAMDGIASLGLAGIIIISVICAFVLLVVDSCAIDLKLEFAAGALAYSAISLANVSLFTTLLGNGLILLMLAFACMPQGISGKRCLSRLVDYP